MIRTEPRADRRDAASAWHALEPEQVAQAFSTSLAGGLDPPEAMRRLQELGPNELEATGGVSPWRLLLEQLRTSVRPFQTVMEKIAAEIAQIHTVIRFNIDASIDELSDDVTAAPEQTSDPGVA